MKRANPNPVIRLPPGGLDAFYARLSAELEGFTSDPALIEVANAAGIGYLLHHNQRSRSRTEKMAALVERAKALDDAAAVVREMNDGPRLAILLEGDDKKASDFLRSADALTAVAAGLRKWSDELRGERPTAFRVRVARNLVRLMRAAGRKPTAWVGSDAVRLLVAIAKAAGDETLTPETARAVMSKAIGKNPRKK